MARHPKCLGTKEETALTVVRGNPKPDRTLMMVAYGIYPGVQRKSKCRLIFVI